MPSYTVKIETFDTPLRPGEEFRNHKIETFEIPGYHAALDFAKAEAAKGKEGRIVTLRNAQGRWGKVVA